MKQIDLSALDPSGTSRWNDAIARIATRGIELRKLRRAVLRRGMTALAFAAAAAFALWISAPTPDSARSERTTHLDMLDWAMRDIDATDAFLGGDHAR